MNIDCLAEICYKPLGDSGEDAYAYNISRGDIQAIAVFDGCGGSGAWKYPEYKNATGAFIAAQSVSKCFNPWFGTVSASDVRHTDALAQSFLDTTRRVLLRLKQSCAPMGISGSLVKSFPCTASVALITPERDGSATLTALNVGDSRVYFLTADGLVQLTKDDSRGSPDPLDSLRDSPPLSNLMNADKEYRVSARQVSLRKPCAVMCATDGIFGFVRSPMDFEYMLIRDILTCGTVAEFESLFKGHVKELTGDDSTCLIAFYGWNDYPGIRNALFSRYRYLEALIGRIDSSPSQDAAVRREWDSYKRDTVYDEMQV